MKTMYDQRINKIILVISILSLPIITSAQKNQIFSKKLIDSEHEYGTTEEQDLFYFALPIVRQSSALTYIRIKLDKQFIDLYSNDNKNFQGQLLNKTIQYKFRESKGREYYKPRKFIYQTQQLDTDVSKKIAQKILTPRQDTIFSTARNPYAQEMRYRSILIQIKSGNSYTELTFSHEKDTLLNRSINAMYEFIHDQLALKKQHDTFINLLPRGKTYYTGAYMKTYLGKKRQRSPSHRFYMYSVSDTLKQYLTDTLNKRIKPANDIRCFDDFYLKLSKKGKLRSIWADIPLNEKIRHPEYRKCKQTIRHAFKTVRADFIKPEKHYYLVLNFAMDGSIYFR